MPATTSRRTSEIVVVAEDRAADLVASVRRLHRHLEGREGCTITIADVGSSDATAVIADALAAELDGVRAVRVPSGLDRKALRQHFAASAADTVAFTAAHPDTDLTALLAPVRLPPPSGPSRFTRRTALAAVGGLGLAALVAACSNGSSVSTATTSGTTASTSGGTTASTSGSTASTSGSTATTASPATSTATTATQTEVTLSPEMTEGPYYVDLDLVRRDIREDRDGTPLELAMSVIDVDTQSPIQGAAVDIWHCDADGLYSGFVSESRSANNGGGTADSGTFLRGTQLTDASGVATFLTIYPGWYQGRAVHIHLKVHVDGREIHTGQLFFDEAVNDEVYATAPYSDRTGNRMLNSSDGIYSRGGSESTAAVSRSGDGYAGSLALGVQPS